MTSSKTLVTSSLWFQQFFIWNQEPNSHLLFEPSIRDFVKNFGNDVTNNDVINFKVNFFIPAIENQLLLKTWHFYNFWIGCWIVKALWHLMADFKGRKRGKSHVQNMGIFFGGSGHGLEPLCQISAYYKFFQGKSYFYRTKTPVYVVSSAKFHEQIKVMQGKNPRSVGMLNWLKQTLPHSVMLLLYYALVHLLLLYGTVIWEPLILLIYRN